MSTTKKKEPKTKYIGTYDIDKYIPGAYNQLRREPDPIDKIFNDQAKMLAQQARHMQVRTYLKQMELDQKKIDQELTKTLNPSGLDRSSEELAKALLTDPNIQKQFFELDDNKQATLLAAANTLTQQGQSTSSLAAFMPFF